MAPVINGRLIFNEHPTGYPEPGKTTVYDESEIIDPDNVALNGGILIKALYLSIDPYLRNRMDVGSKTPGGPFELGKPLATLGIGLVIRSEIDGFKPGDHIHGFLLFQEYTLLPTAYGLRVLKDEPNVPLTVYLGAAGLTGLTAYSAWNEFAKPEPGNVVFVSAAAGGVGSVVVQLAKAAGLKVIGSAGSDDKVEWVKSIGADVAFNYKTQNTFEILEKEGPIDIYWDNVGGETLDAALAHAAIGARFIECGVISGYNTEPKPLRNFINIIVRDIALNGFTSYKLGPKYEEKFYAEMPKKIASGEIKYTEELTRGLKYGGHALEAILRGTNKGKSVVVVSEE